MRSTVLKSLVIGLVALLAAMLLAGCGGGKSAATVTASPKANLSTPSGTPRVVQTTPGPSPTPIGPAPTPGHVDYAKMQMIDEWRAVQVPQYPGAKRTDFQPETGSSVQNAGSMLWQTADSAAQVISFYRGALPFLGWKEQSANAVQVLMTNGNAALVVNVVQRTNGTQIVMTLSDKLGTG